MLLKKVFLGVSLLLCFGHCEWAGAQATKLVVAYASPAATFCPGWIAKREGIFFKYGLDVEMVLMQGASTYMPALASGNIQVLYGGGTAVSRAIATGGFDLTVIATETRYVPLRLMVHPAIQSGPQLKGKKLGAGQAGLDEYATILYLEKIGLVPNKDVQLVYLAGGVPSRAAAMKQGLIDGVAVNPPKRIRTGESGVSRTRQFSGSPDAVCRCATYRDSRLSRQKPQGCRRLHDRCH